jgi:hypothetical protein
VTSLIVIKKVDLKVYPNFGAATAEVETLPSGLTAINIDGNLTRVLNGRLLVYPQLLFSKFENFKILPTGKIGLVLDARKN